VTTPNTHATTTCYATPYICTHRSHCTSCVVSTLTSNFTSCPASYQYYCPRDVTTPSSYRHLLFISTPVCPANCSAFTQAQCGNATAANNAAASACAWQVPPPPPPSPPAAAAAPADHKTRNIIIGVVCAIGGVGALGGLAYVASKNQPVSKREQKDDEDRDPKRNGPRLRL
jgi:hypothetical protein